MKTKITIEIKADEALIKAIENLIALIQASNIPSVSIPTTWTCKPPFIPTSESYTLGKEEATNTDTNDSCTKESESLIKEHNAGFSLAYDIILRYFGYVENPITKELLQCRDAMNNEIKRGGNTISFFSYDMGLTMWLRKAGYSVETQDVRGMIQHTITWSPKVLQNKGL